MDEQWILGYLFSLFSKIEKKNSDIWVEKNFYAHIDTPKGNWAGRNFIALSFASLLNSRNWSVAIKAWKYIKNWNKEF